MKLGQVVLAIVSAFLLLFGVAGKARALCIDGATCVRLPGEGGAPQEFIGSLSSGGAEAIPGTTRGGVDASGNALVTRSVHSDIYGDGWQVLNLTTLAVSTCYPWAGCGSSPPEAPAAQEPSDCPAGATMVGGGCVLNGERDKDKDRCPERSEVDVSWQACTTSDGQAGTGTQILTGTCLGALETRTCCKEGTKCGGWGECDPETRIRTRTCTVYKSSGEAMACRTTKQYTEGQSCVANISGNVFDTSVEGASCNNPLDNSTVGVKVKALGQKPQPTGEEVMCDGKPFSYAADKSGWTSDYANPEWYDPDDARIEYIGDNWQATSFWIGDTCDWDPERGCTRRYGGGVYGKTSPRGERIIKYGGPWNDYYTQSYLNFYSDSQASGGGVLWIGGLPGFYASLTFTGSSITYYRHIGPNDAIVEVWLDGQKVEELDNYSATEQWQIKQTYTTTPGSHTFKVVHSGRVNPQATSTGLVIDAFEVDSGQLIQENDYPQTKIKVSFTGNRIDYWRAMQAFVNSEDFKCFSPSTCRRSEKANVWLDGEWVEKIQNVTGGYSNNTQLSNGAYTLTTTQGDHILEIVADPNPKVSYTGWINTTGFEVYKEPCTLKSKPLCEADKTTLVDSTGSYFVANLCIPDVYTMSLDSGGRFSDEIGLYCDGSHVVTLSTLGQMAVRRFGLEGGGKAWIQAEGSGNVYATGEISNPIPESCQGSCDPHLISVLGGGSPGVVSYGGVKVDLGSGEASTKKWLVNSLYQGKKYSYRLYFNQLGFSANSEADYEGVLLEVTKPSVAPKSGTAYLVRGDMTIANSSWQVGKGEKIAILVDGDVNIKTTLEVAEGGWLGFIVSGDINIDQNVGGDGPEAAIEGVYVAEGTINTGVADLKLITEGTFVGWGGVNLERSLPGGRNKTEPAEVWRYRPDFLANLPDFLKRPNFAWQEVAP